MDDFENFETEFLLPMRRKRCWRRSKKCLVGSLMAVVLLASCAVIALIANCYINGNCQETKKEQKHDNGLPNSFSTTVEVVYGNNATTRHERTVIDIAWDKDKDDFRYRETNHFFQKDAANSSVDDALIRSAITITNKKTSLKVNGINIPNAACDVHRTKVWHLVFKTMLTQIFHSFHSSECPGKMWKTKGNDEISFCSSDSKLVFVRNGQSLAKVTKWKTPIGVDSIPLLSTGINCNGTRKLELSDIGSKRKPKPLTGRRTFSKSNKTCLFVHGTGVDLPKEGYANLNEFDYWGNIQNYTPQCNSHRFIKFDTVTNGWDNPALHKFFCDFSDATSNGMLIKDKIIFSHSFGNLVIAAALRKGTCKLDMSSTNWFSVQAPWSGSAAADKLEQVCKCVFKTCHIPFDKEIKEIVSSMFNYCNGPVMSHTYKTLQTNYISSTGITFDDLKETAEAHISGVLCGTSALGIGKKWYRSLALEMVQKFSGMKLPNDGMVSLESCDITGGFKDTYKSRYYKAHINHEEGTCRFGDSWLNSEKPCEWYGEMAERAVSGSKNV